MKTKTARWIKILTNASAILATLAAGLATMPIDSESLPLPPSWRPYQLGIGLIVVALRRLIVPMLDTIIKNAEQP